MKHIIPLTLLLLAPLAALRAADLRVVNEDFSGLSGLKPVRLRCEYLANPLGIDVWEPRLRWALESESNGQTQTAYRILAASSADGSMTWADTSPAGSNCG